MQRLKEIMMRFLAWIGTAMLLLSFAGCAKAQREPFVTSRGNAELTAQIQKTGEATLPPSFPQEENVQMAFAHDTLPLSVKVDAAVGFPQVAAIPVFSVQPCSFPEREAMRIAEALAGGAFGATGEKMTSADGLAHWQFADAAQSLLVGSSVIYRRADTPLVRTAYPRYARSMTVLPELAIEGFPYETATAQADALVREVTQESFRLAEVYAVAHTSGRQWYALGYARDIGGVPCALLNGTIGNDTGEYATWEYERLWLLLDADGLMRLEWTSPMELSAALNESVTLVPFADVMECFQQMFLLNNSHYETEAQSARYVDAYGDVAIGVADDSAADTGAVKNVSAVTLHVNGVELQYMRVQSGSEYVLIPAWNFWGYADVTGGDGQPFDEGADRFPRLLLSINAFDGSIIDAGIGA